MVKMNLSVSLAIVLGVYVNWIHPTSVSAAGDTASISAVPADSSTQIRDGVRFSVKYRAYPTTNQAMMPFGVFVLSVDPAKMDVEVFVSSEKSGQTLGSVVNSDGLLAAISGGYLASISPPLPAGLIKTGNNTIVGIAEKDPVLDTVICLAPSVEFMASEKFRSSAAAADDRTDCRQIGPSLVDQGRISLDANSLDRTLGSAFSANLYRRAAIAVSGEGRVLLVWTTPVPLDILASVLARPTDRGGFGAVSASALPGRYPAGLAWGGGDQVQFVGTADFSLPDFLVVKPK